VPPRILPDPPPKFKEPSEGLILSLLAEQLGDEYVVLCARRWNAQGEGRNPDVECDFIVAKPGGAILVLEVKGGVWERRDGRWYANKNLVKENEDPFYQAMANKHALLALLKRSANWATTFFPMWHAVALPDTPLHEGGGLQDLPPVLSQTELRYVREWMDSEMASCVSATGKACTPPMVDHLIQCLVRDHCVRLKDIFKTDEDKLIVLTQQQLELDRSLTRKRRLTVQGCAGSGKTLMAVRQARRLAALPDVNQVLLTCYNLELGGWLAAMTDDIRSSCTVKPFLALCEEHTLSSGMPLPDSSNLVEYYRKLPDAMQNALAVSPLRFDAIVVDEGQAFKADYWALLELMLSDPQDSYMYIFFDDFQRVFDEEHNRVPGEDDPFLLTKNIRNTAAIHRQAIVSLPPEAVADPNHVGGQPVEIGRYKDERELVRQLKRILHRMIVEGGVSAKDIVILTGRSAEKSILPHLAGSGALTPRRLTPVEVDDPGAIRYTSVHKYRGLERQVVILCELREEDALSVNYLGSSRARAKLFVLLPEGLPIAIHSLLAQRCQPLA